MNVFVFDMKVRDTPRIQLSGTGVFLVDGEPCEDANLIYDILSECGRGFTEALRSSVAVDDPRLRLETYTGLRCRPTYVEE